MNLVDLIINKVNTPENIDKLGSAAGVNKEDTSNALENLVPLLTKALGNQGESGVGNLLENMSGGGSDMVNQLLGNKMGLVTQLLGKTTNLDSGQSSDLLGKLVPMVMGALGQEKENQGLDASGFANLLNKSNEEAAQGNSQLGMIASLLDQDGDGEITDDLLNIGKGLLGNMFK